MGPPAKRARVIDGEAAEDEQDVGPKPMPALGPQPDSDAEEDDDDDGEDSGADDLDDESTFPITHEISMKDHTKVGVAPSWASV
jgi:hypothetical protein